MKKLLINLLTQLLIKLDPDTVITPWWHDHGFVSKQEAEEWYQKEIEMVLEEDAWEEHNRELEEEQRINFEHASRYQVLVPEQCFMCDCLLDENGHCMNDKCIVNEPNYPFN